MNTAEIEKERLRLLRVIDEAKVARAKIRQLDRLIVLYGDSVPDSALVEDETSEPAGVNLNRRGTPISCSVPGCGQTLGGWQGILPHLRAHKELSEGERLDHRAKMRAELGMAI